MEKIQWLSKALELVATQEKYLSSDLRSTQRMNWVWITIYNTVKKQGYLDYEIKHSLNSLAYALDRWKKSLVLTKDVVCDFLEVMYLHGCSYSDRLNTKVIVKGYFEKIKDQAVFWWKNLVHLRQKVYKKLYKKD